MNQRLVWNFEFSPKVALALETPVDKKDDHLKWEIRYFWSDDKPIILNTIDSSLLDLKNYQQKHKEDFYYLLPKSNYNIKRRHNKLLYKPLVKYTQHAVGFGAKIILNRFEENPQPNEPIPPALHKAIPQIEKNGVGILVKKEALIYKFPTQPKIKMELARLEVLHKTYFSVCVEGKSLYLVETISKYLLGEHVSCDYVTFLKNILKL